MRILKIVGDTVDRVSYEAYGRHLDEIRSDLPDGLYPILKFPEEAYRSGNTFHDAVVIRWCEELDTNTWRSDASMLLRSRNGLWKYEFSFQQVESVTPADDRPAHRTGELRAVEVVRLEAGSVSIGFLYQSIAQLEVVCKDLGFRALTVSKS